MRYFFTLCFLLSMSHVANAEVFSSGNARVGLLELYTSEGCSSCPPADRFLSGLKDDAAVFRDFIPVALHVDYWNYLGWKDRFASEAHSQRQRSYAREGGVRTVYTPGFVYNGREWRHFFGGDTSELPRGGSAGELIVSTTDGQAEVRFSPATSGPKQLRVTLALLGFGLRTEVASGENRGRDLAHDFVVLAQREASLKNVGDHYQQLLALPATTVQAERYALVAWVSGSSSQTPLQATGGYLVDDVAVLN